ncbi:hypothetical protein [Phytomonospora endophytica]|uniref:Uncharacterized protein n=1 Tax=Phytomonospora endophytica TaxID=714109 RepID=A0A841FUF6_9ACTN|nr:hypothetical protein [Phytomonospora endophytica]MBB6036977.1 hypothetical protein [Phytomonospora endophytica]
MTTATRTPNAEKTDLELATRGGCAAEHGAVAEHLARCIEDAGHDGPHVAVGEDAETIALWD